MVTGYITLRVRPPFLGGRAEIRRAGKTEKKEGPLEDITRWREDMTFIFEWQNNILRTSAASE